MKNETIILERDCGAEKAGSELVVSKNRARVLIHQRFAKTKDDPKPKPDENKRK